MADRPSPFSVWSSVITRDTAGIWKIFNWPPMIFKLSPFCSLETLRICSLHVSVWSESSQSCQTLCEPMDYTAHRILQAKMPECVAIPSFRASSQPRDGTQVSALRVGSLPAKPQRKPIAHMMTFAHWKLAVMLLHIASTFLPAEYSTPFSYFLYSMAFHHVLLVLLLPVSPELLIVIPGIQKWTFEL